MSQEKKEQFDVLFSFFSETDRFKDVEREILLRNGRNENDAEHTWHCLLMALVLHKKLEEPVNLEKVLKILIVHDLPEVYAGDVSVFDKEEREGKKKAERQAVQKLFSSLDNETCDKLLSLWHEYEEAKTPEARFAKAIDKIQPFAQNLFVNGRGPWEEREVTENMVREIKEKWVSYDPFLADFNEYIIQRAKKEGVL